jgi:uncharacterized membrane protein
VAPAVKRRRGAREGRALLLLAVITTIGAALRLYGLDVQSLWNDELAAWDHARFATWTEVVDQGTPAEHPPGYFVFLHFWMQAAGDSEVRLRLPSALAGILVLPAVFVLGRKLYGDVEGLIAAGLFAVAWMPVYYSQEARGNMMLLLLAVQSSSWLIDIAAWLRQQRQLPATAIVGYLVTATLACYLHYFGVLLVVLQAVFVGFLCLRHPSVWWRVAAIYAAVALAYAPWLERASAALVAGPSWMEPPRPTAFWDLVEFMWNRSSVIAAVAVALCLWLGVRALWAAWRHPGGRRRAFASTGMLLALWATVPVVLVYVRSITVAPAFHNRHFLIIAPAVYLLVARAVTQISPRPAARGLAGAALIAVLLFDLLVVKDYFRRPTKAQFREAAAYLVQHDDPRATTVVLSFSWRPAYFDYYLERLGSPRRVDLRARQPEEYEAVRRVLAERSADVVWLLAAEHPPAPQLVELLERQLTRVGEQRFVAASAGKFVRR